MIVGRILGLFALAATAVFAQIDIDTTTPEGQLLQQIGIQEETQQKIAMLEAFMQQYPDHSAVEWVLAQLPPAYAELNQAEKSLSWCEKLLEKDPANAAASHSCLKTAEAQKDAALIQKWALLTHGAAHKAVSAPKPEFEYEEDEEEWKQAIDFAKQVGQYSEWSLYNAALQAQDPTVKLQLTTALRGANPESEHLAILDAQIFRGYLQGGQMDKAVEIIEAAVAKGVAEPGMLVVAADYYFNQKQSEKAMDYCGKVIEVFEGKDAPEGADPAAWDTQKKNSLGRAYWMMGVTYSTQSKYASADKALRKALPNVSDNAPLLAGALFHLGLANFQLGNKSGKEQQILDAFKYTKQCAAMKSPFQAQAKRNLAAIQTQYRIK